jgi:hypothetical protein
MPWVRHADALHPVDLLTACGAVQGELAQSCSRSALTFRSSPTHLLRSDCDRVKLKPDPLPLSLAPAIEVVDRVLRALEVAFADEACDGSWDTRR